MKEILIIGAGASGLAAAVSAARSGARVTVLEKEKKPAMKLLRTGNGRCNLANAGDPDSGYEGADAGFAAALLAEFGADGILDFFRDLGLEVRDFDGWYYPASEEARSVSEALLRACREHKVKLKLNEEVTGIEKKSDGRFYVATRSWTYEADAVIVSAGTYASLPADTPDPMQLVSAFGLKSEPMLPALVPLHAASMPCQMWAGARVRGYAGLYVEGSFVKGEYGQIQFTRKGISGISIFNLSVPASLALKNGKKVSVILDLLHGLADRARIEAKITELGTVSERKGVPEEAFRSYLTGLVPEKLADVILRRWKAGEDAGQLVTAFEIPISGAGSAMEAQALCGGIRCSELNPETMEVLACPGLYITGEMLEPVGHCGGYNLSFAWITGLYAGRAAGM